MVAYIVCVIQIDGQSLQSNVQLAAKTDGIWLLTAALLSSWDKAITHIYFGI